MKPKRICSICHKIKSDNCERCKPKPTNFKDIDRTNQPFYNSRAWRRCSKGYLLRHPLCVSCEAKGLITPSKVTDHIVPISKGGDKWDSSNFQALCNRCHNSKTAKSR